MVNLVNFATGEGGANHQLGLMLAWQMRGWSVHVLAPDRVDQETRTERTSGVEFTWPISRWGVARIFNALPQLAYVVRSRLRDRSSVLYVRANSFTFLHVILARLIGMFVVVEHNSWLSSERSIRGGSAVSCALDRRFQIWSARLAHLSRCVTPGIASLLEASGIASRKLFVVGNGTDLRGFRPLDRNRTLTELGLDPSRIWLGFIGILTPWQGVETAVAALGYLDDLPRVKLIIAGEGPERERLAQLACELGLQDRIVFLGAIEYSRANLVINAFDVALAPFTQRRNEEIGLSALKLRDYAAAGRVVVASDIAGVRELSNGGWLFLHAPDRAGDLAAVLRAVLADQTSWAARSRMARAYAERHFDWNRIAADIGDRICDAMRQS
jgi:glycosyltransferase involved in cell wall biosynthesis